MWHDWHFVWNSGVLRFGLHTLDIEAQFVCIWADVR